MTATKPDTPEDFAGHPGRPPHLMAILAHALRGPLWLAGGMVVSAIALGCPGCVGLDGHGPSLLAKADFTAKEPIVETAARGKPGELAVAISVEVRWPGR